jgi:phosphoribosyl-ATP pyrophosphohydrolase
MTHPVDSLFEVISARRGGDATSSYTARLFERGTSVIARKVGEEAVETVVEALSGSKETLTAESADLLYHLLVLWADADIDPKDIWDELARRAGTSGLEEKASRAIFPGTGKD